MAKKNLVNAQTNQSVKTFIDAVENDQRRADCRTLLKLMKDLTGEPPKMWGKNMIGFGKYSYQRKNGDELEWFKTGFAPAKAHMSIYLMYDLDNEPELRDQLGPHKKGKGCLYIKRLDDIDMNMLKKIIAKSDRLS